MLLVVSALKNYQLLAMDGRLGTVTDFLFDDRTWRLRWVVVDTGNWLASRKVLVHPTALGQPNYDRQEFPVKLTKAMIEASPAIEKDQPVSRQMEDSLFGYYGSDPLLNGRNYFGVGVTDSELGPDIGNGDPHLRSAAAVTGYHVHATDGQIGHVENFLIDDGSWDIRYLIIDTKNWWPGKHVLMSPYAVQEVNWPDRLIRLNVIRDKVKTSPPWDPIDMIDRVYEKRLHSHFGWQGYGF